MEKESSPIAIKVSVSPVAPVSPKVESSARKRAFLERGAAPVSAAPTGGEKPPAAAPASETRTPKRVCVESTPVPSLLRIKKELVNIIQNPLPDIVIGPTDVADLYHWVAKIPGPSGTPYEGGSYFLSIFLGDGYPFRPPKIRFETKIYHCNISNRGDICLDILKSNWSPALTMVQVILSILLLLQEPNPGDPLDPDIAKHLKTDKADHDRIAREWTQRHAVRQCAAAPPPPRSSSFP